MPATAPNDVLVLDSGFSSQHESERIDLSIYKFLDLIPSRSVAAKLVENGFVKLHSKSKQLKPSYRIRSGDVFTIDLSEFTQTTEALASPMAQAIPLDILFEDDDVLVVNKPAGLVVHPGAGVPDGTLVNAVLHHCGQTLPSLGEPLRAGIVHRLDRDTSGVMVVAKSQLALTELSKQFASHTQHRRYLALCYNVPNPAASRIETLHGRDARNRFKYAVVDEGKPAVLNYDLQKTFASNRFSLVQCELQTGRTHQIRVQLTHIGCPLVGDALYGHPPGKVTNEKMLWSQVKPLATRQMLHASQLAFTHPRTLLRCSFESPLPADFSGLLLALEKL